MDDSDVWGLQNTMGAGNARRFLYADSSSSHSGLLEAVVMAPRDIIEDLSIVSLAGAKSNSTIKHRQLLK